MRLFMIQFDNQQFYVEAPSFAEAISTWNQHQKEEWADDAASGWDGTEQPESVSLVSDDPVIRKKGGT